LRQQHLVFKKGHTYSVQFKMHASQKMRAYLRIGQAGRPTTNFWKLLFNLDTQAAGLLGDVHHDRRRRSDVEGRPRRRAAGEDRRGPYKVCIDDDRLDDPQYAQKPPEMPGPVPMVLVNQVGYFPRLAKIATVAIPAAVSWQLLDGTKKVVAQGPRTVGADAASGDQSRSSTFSNYVAKETDTPCASALT